MVEEILEKRIQELEKKVFGLEGKPPQNAAPETNIIESLSHANTLISSALSGRESLNALISRLPELEKYVESDFDPVDLQTDTKLEYIMAMEPEIRENAQQLNKMKELMPILDSDRFKNLPELTSKLENLTLKYVNFGEEVGKVDGETKNLVTRYNEIITNISRTLIFLNEEITKLEEAAAPKKISD
ncbi:hypothetical protein QAD02_004943 [Eretmocerus hayati]|uniref:Uncharacterized protein n=1 Tax=Eretmocerus hayati TaxID=131215 RepID=A0ACC2NS27_9HYME|nr:hypothetical protein QAD02_004943 [Eretmocerus hayati]